MLKCSDLGNASCMAVFKSDVVDEIVKQASEHAKMAHSADITQEIIEKMKGLIKDEAAQPVAAPAQHPAVPAEKPAQAAQPASQPAVQPAKPAAPAQHPAPAATPAAQPAAENKEPPKA